MLTVQFVTLYKTCKPKPKPNFISNKLHLREIQTRTNQTNHICDLLVVTRKDLRRAGNPNPNVLMSSFVHHSKYTTTRVNTDIIIDLL